LLRSAEGAYANSKDTGFLVGGWAGGWTDASLPSSSSFSVPNIVSFNMATKLWSNDSGLAFTQFGTDVRGAAEFIDSFDPNGILLLLGGAANAAGSQNTGAGLLDFNNLTFYDPVSKEWYWQATTGDVPPPDKYSVLSAFQGLVIHTKCWFSSKHSLNFFPRLTFRANCIASFSVVLITSLTHITMMFTF
jgi:hypothetical protein